LSHPASRHYLPSAFIFSVFGGTFCALDLPTANLLTPAPHRLPVAACTPAGRRKNAAAWRQALAPAGARGLGGSHGTGLGRRHCASLVYRPPTALPTQRYFHTHLPASRMKEHFTKRHEPPPPKEGGRKEKCWQRRQFPARSACGGGLWRPSW